jgi:two-component system, chemotaxis family, chemotaxis protein CheY
MDLDTMSQGRDVLVVDDDPMILDLVTEFLEDEGYCVRRAHNGLEALMAIEMASPALLVTDIRMPMMDGSELVMSLRAHDYEFPILLIAATPALAAPLLQFDRTMYIEKPFELEMLLDIVRLYVRPAIAELV